MEVDPLIHKMAAAIRAQTENTEQAPLMIGIKRGGAWIARRLHRQLGYPEPLGELNIAFYRDDFSTLGLHPEVSPSRLPVTINDRQILLIDDVLYTGRTVRAALNELFDYGRPAGIRLAVLIDRGGRELPIQADIVGHTLALKEGEHVKLTGPDPLTLDLRQGG